MFGAPFGGMGGLGGMGQLEAMMLRMGMRDRMAAEMMMGEFEDDTDDMGDFATAPPPRHHGRRGGGMRDFDDIDNSPQELPRRRQPPGFEMPRPIFEEREPPVGRRMRSPFNDQPPMPREANQRRDHFGQRARHNDDPGFGHMFDPSRQQRFEKQKKAAKPEPKREQGTLAKYDKVRSLTPGGMSKSITVVRNLETGKLYVNKQIRTEGILGQRAKAERNALKAVRGHPNLNQFIECEVQVNGICNFILEYCDGGSLDARIEELISRRHGFNEASIWHVLQEVAKGLAFMHTGILDIQRDSPKEEWDTICHLDLKPQNIFLSGEKNRFGQRRVILADFGCAVTLSDITKGREPADRQRFGTSDWYPPEGLAGKGYGTKTDIFMLGATIQVLCLLIDSPHHSTLASSTPCGRKFSSSLQRVVKELTNDRAGDRPSARKIAVLAMQMFRMAVKEKR